MATVVLDRLLGCDGFRVESPEGLLGWVEEAWLGPSREPTALAIRTIDGRRGLLVAGEIETVVLERELVAVLYLSLALIVTLVIGLAFLVARLVTGNAV